MVTDTYAHSFDLDRKLIAKEMDSEFFSKIESKSKNLELDNETIAKIKLLLEQKPELIDDLINQIN